MPQTLLDFLNGTTAQVVIWCTVTLVIGVFGYWLVQRFRDQSDDDQQTASDLLTNYREMFQQGDIDEKEYRTIKTVLGTKLQDEINDAGDTD